MQIKMARKRVDDRWQDACGPSIHTVRPLVGPT